MIQYVQLFDIVEKYNITLLVTFGSYNTERFSKHSDIDVGFISEYPMNDDKK